jgi:peptidoglycan/xylan/chitin deacetylase (PgdA/CDA1 family)
MSARIAFFLRRFLPVGALSCALLALVVIGVDTSAFGLLQPSARHQHTPTSSPTAALTPTPSPTPTPQPPLVPLLWHGNPNLPEIALTFDDGPAPDTKDILGVLRHYHILATFFMLGIWVQHFPDLARAVVADGHAIGDHTWDHADLTRLSTQQAILEITDARNMIEHVTGITPFLFRPPYGAYTHQLVETVHSLKFCTVTWSSDPRDWTRPGVGSIITSVLNNTQNGSIILMHDGGGDRQETIGALPTIIERLLARGFTFVTIPQMLLHLPPPTGPNHLPHMKRRAGAQGAGRVKTLITPSVLPALEQWDGVTRRLAPPRQTLPLPPPHVSRRIPPQSLLAAAHRLGSPAP